MPPDSTPLQNQLLAAISTADCNRIAKHLRLQSTVVGDTLHEHGSRIDEVYFPDGGVVSITNHMRDDGLVEVATVGREGMLGVGVFLGDRSAYGRTMQQVPGGPLVALAVAPFLRAATAGTFRKVMGQYAQAMILQTMQGTACNALHGVSQRCCRWLLQIHVRHESQTAGSGVMRMLCRHPRPFHAAGSVGTRGTGDGDGIYWRLLLF